MIEVDISNIWCGLSLPDLLAIEKEVAEAHEAFAAKAESTAWLSLSEPENGAYWERIQEAARNIRETGEICVILSAGDLCLGAQAAMELLGQKDGPKILFAGDTLSTRQWNALNRKLEGKDVSVIVMSLSGTTLESAIAFRGLRWLLERRYGTQEAARRIYAVTLEDSALWQMAQQQNWQCFAVPQGVEGSHSVLSAAGLLPMAVAGIDILELVQGAEKARKEFDLRSFENPLWLYAGGRNALLRRGRRIELFGSTAPEVRALARWWQQLSAQEETSGIFPVLAEYPRTIRCLGKRIADGGDVFETLVRFVWEEPPYTIGSDVCDLDGLNDLAGKTLDQIQDQAFQSVLAEHSDAGVPVITMACGQLGAGTLGELFGFLELASGLSGCISNQSFREP